MTLLGGRIQIIDPVIHIALPEIVKGDMQRFINELEVNPALSLKPFGLDNTKLDENVELIRTIYSLPA